MPELKRLSWEELTGLFEGPEQDKLTKLREEDAMTHVVVFETPQTNGGMRTALPVDAPFNDRVIDGITHMHLNGQFLQYPVAYWQKVEEPVLEENYG